MKKRRKRVIIRDPIHNIIEFDESDTDQLLINLINTKEFQRLRRIKQLGFSDFTFPGATHSRFAHSLGVLQITRKMLDLVNFKEIDDEEKTIILCAALLHDIGHGPFSHAFENVTKKKHETWTKEIIQAEATEVNQVLRDFDEEFPKKVALFETEPYLKSLLDSQFDADRFDYLLRDSYCTGAKYGVFDLEWILRHLRFDDSFECLYLEEKAMLAAEEYVFARYHMYTNVYFHKATRAAEVILKAILDRCKTLLEAGDGNIDNLVPAPLQRPFQSENHMQLEDYLQLHDGSIFFLLSLLSHSAADATLKRLANAINSRKLFKCLSLPQNVSLPEYNNFKDKLKEKIRQEIDGPDSYVLEDDPGNVPYVNLATIGNEEEKHKSILIKISGKLRNISSVSKPVNQLTDKILEHRIYFPMEFKENAVTIYNKIWGTK